MTPEQKIRLVLIASGSGTDANAIMSAFRAGGLLPECQVVLLISTKVGAGCLSQAEYHGVPSRVVERAGKAKEIFAVNIMKALRGVEANLVFLVGCIPTIPVVDGVDMYNIHPADPVAHGGKGMYGLAPHRHVLAACLDQRARQMLPPGKGFFTFPTVHEASAEVDQGASLLTARVEIPWSIINQAETDLEAAAVALQRLVLSYEHRMLPAAVNLACLRFLRRQQSAV